MSEKQIEQIRNMLPAGEKLDRMYRAFEGDIRVISRDAAGSEKRYTVRLNADGGLRIEEM